MDDRRIEDAYRRYFPAVREKCRRVVRGTQAAEELAQETFVRLLEERATLRDPDAVLGWVYRTATRLAIDRARRDRFVVLGIVDEDCGSHDDERRIVATIDVGRVLDRLDDEALEVAIFAYLDGMTQAEIATLTNRSDRTVRRILERVSQTIRVERRKP